MYLKMDAFSTGKIHFTFLSDLFVQTISDGGETIQSLACGRGGSGYWLLTGAAQDHPCAPLFTVVPLAKLLNLSPN